MASWQSEAVAELYRAWTEELNNPDPERQEPRETNDRWGDLTAEPRGVDYLEREAAGGQVLWVQPHEADEDQVLFYLHGGGFIGGSVYTHRKLVGHLAKAAGLRGCIVSYPHTPQHRHPSQLIQTVATYRWLLDQGVSAHRIIFGGDSAGAAMALGTVLTAREEGLPQPAGVFLISPWVDMTVSNPSYETNAERDFYFSKPVVAGLAGMFLGNTDPRDPFASPAFADLAGMPPLYIQVGGDETLLDDATNLHERTLAAGSLSSLDIFPEQQHTFQMVAGRGPEADDAVARFAAWARRLVGFPVPG